MRTKTGQGFGLRSPRARVASLVAVCAIASALALPSVAAAAPPTITSFSPTSAPAGTKVTITGTDLAGATIVRLGGMIATFTVLSPTQIRATVPTKAPGYYRWQVTTAEGVATSVTFFRLLHPNCAR